MIEVLKQRILPGTSPEQKTNLAREYLQVLALKAMSDLGAFRNVAFIGGTALRILFGLRRFSEDLDFSLVRREGYGFEALCAGVERFFALNGLKAAAALGKDRTVNSAFVDFPDLPHALGLSGHRAEKLSIKLEVDTDPPAGWASAATLLNRGYLFSVAHYDEPSLFSGKLHACFYRKYTKGRDIYDLFWYLGRKTRPNYELLNNAIAQSRGAAPGVNAGNFRDFMLAKAATIDMAAARRDVERFLEDKSELSLFDTATLLAALRSAVE